jgi:hypothetical protein
MAVNLLIRTQQYADGRCKADEIKEAKVGRI